MSITETHEQTNEALAEEASAAFADKIFTDLLGAMSTYAVSIGVELGWYEALAGVDAMSSPELASATATDERYAREWLEQQTVTGYLSVVDATASPSDRRFSIAPEAAEILADRSSVAFMAPYPASWHRWGAAFPG